MTSPGRRRASAMIRSTRVPVRERSTSRRQLGVADAARAVGLGRRAHRSDERGLAAERHLDVLAPGQLEHGAGVLGDLPRVDVAADAGDGDQVCLGRRRRVEQREAVVDAGVDVEDQGRGHRRWNLAGAEAAVE